MKKSDAIRKSVHVRRRQFIGTGMVSGLTALSGCTGRIHQFVDDQRSRFTGNDEPNTSAPANIGVKLEYGDPQLTSVLPDAPARFTVTSAAGTEFTLSIPRGAVVSTTDIKLIPISSLEGSAFSNSFIAGVQMEPEGVTFFEPVDLEIAIPSHETESGVIGFGYHGNGEGFHLEPVSVDSPVVKLQLTHFSGAGVIESPKDCTDLEIDHLSPEDIAKQLVGCITSNRQTAPDYPNNITLAERDQINAVLNNWFYDTVLPTLDAAVGCLRDEGCSDNGALLRGGTREYVRWETYLQVITSLLYYDEGFLERNVFPTEIDLAYADIETGFKLRLQQLEAACSSSSDRDVKKSMTKEILYWQAVDDILGRDFVTVTTESICDGFLETVPRSVKIDEFDGPVHVGESKTLTATVHNQLGAEIDETDLTWRSSDPLIASVSASDHNEATISGLNTGSVTVTADLEGTSDSIAVEVQSPVGTLSGHVWIDDGDGEFDPKLDQALVDHPVAISGMETLDVTTDQTGMYRVEDVPPGEYTVVLASVPDGIFWNRLSADVSLETAGEIQVNFIGSENGSCELESFTDLGTFGHTKATIWGISDNDELLVLADSESYDYYFGGESSTRFYYPLDGKPIEITDSQYGPLYIDSMSESGICAGWYWYVPPDVSEPINWRDLVKHACQWTPTGGLVDVNPAGPTSYRRSAVFDVNDAGTMVGTAWFESGRDWGIWGPSGSFTSLPFVGKKINNNGFVIDGGMRGGGWIRAPDGTLTRLEIPWDDGLFTPRDLNDNNEVAGWGYAPGDFGRETHALLWADGNVTDLGILSRRPGRRTSSHATGINDAGVVVGESYVSGDERHAFFWTAEDGMVDLHPSGYETSWALAINNLGTVAGIVRDKNGIQSAAVWRLTCRSN